MMHILMYYISYRIALLYAKLDFQIIVLVHVKHVINVGYVHMAVMFTHVGRYYHYTCRKMLTEIKLVNAKLSFIDKGSGQIKHFSIKCDMNCWYFYTCYVLRYSIRAANFKSYSIRTIPFTKYFLQHTVAYSYNNNIP